MNMNITKREIIVSIAMVAIMLVLGIFISSKINDSHLDKVQQYNTALPIDTQEMFEYGMNTNVGNAFVYGDLSVVDAVSYDEIDGEYWYVYKSIQEYRMHTRTVTETYTGSDGKTHTRTRTEVYWSWDEVESESKTCTKVVFLGVQFPQSKFSYPYTQHIDTVDAGYHKRFVFEGVPTNFTGTIYTKLKDGDISDNNSLYINKNIEETRDTLISFNWCYVFWIFWIVLTVGMVFGFYYIDNRWLE